MKKDLSLFLDLWRFAAAMVVFLAHTSGQKISGGFLWQLNLYDQSAVIIFFVLSGFVIAFVSKTKEKDLKTYSIARISRLYSIVIPALLLTFILDSIGLQLNPSYYLDGPWPYSPDNHFRDYFFSFFMLQHIWSLNITPGINGPFWSLTFEAIYYGLFAASFYLRGKTRLTSITLIALLGGPTILALFPIWLIGYYLYQKLSIKDQSRDTWLQGVISILALLLLILFSPYVREITFNIPFVSRGEILGDYFDAILFTIHIYYSGGLLILIKKLLFNFENSIRWLASLTFSLYLFHRPIIQLIGAINYDNVDSIYNRTMLIAGTLLIVAILGRWAENQKFRIRKFFQKHLIVARNKE